MPKAWAVISIDAVNPSIDDGVNIASAQYITIGSPNRGLQITFPTGGEMASSNYAVMASVDTTGSSGVTNCFSVNLLRDAPYNPTATTFTLVAHDMAGNVQPWTSLSPNATKVFVFVFGKQS